MDQLDTVLTCRMLDDMEPDRLRRRRAPTSIPTSADVDDHTTTLPKDDVSDSNVAGANLPWR